MMVFITDNRDFINDFSSLCFIEREIEKVKVTVDVKEEKIG